MNIDFSTDPTFSSYVLLLIFAGIAMLAMAAVNHANRNVRLLNALFGVGFLGYGIYLLAMFNGESYVLFYYAFILPVILAYRTFASWRESRTAPDSGPAAVPSA